MPASLLELEIREQALVLEGRRAEGWAHARRAAELLRTPDVEYLLIAARGSSDNAARYAQYLFGMRACLQVSLAAPWLYTRPRPPRMTRGAAIAISQSGRSPDIVGVLAAARVQGRPAIAITNDPESPLALEADVVVPLLAGEERSVAATKTYLASLHALAQIASVFAGAADDASWFARLPGMVNALVEEQLETRSRFDRLSEVALLTVLGRGLQLATAYETALKVRELSGITAEAFSPADLMHGPIAAIGRTTALWQVMTGSEPGGAGLTVSVSDDPGLLATADIPVAIPGDLPEWLVPLLAVIPAQAAALRLAELRGIDVDHPPGLRKVTLTR